MVRKTLCFIFGYGTMAAHVWAIAPNCSLRPGTALNVRAEGVSELLRPLEMVCSGTLPSGSNRLEVQIASNVDITSRQVAIGTEFFSDAVAVVGTPAAAQTRLCLPGVDASCEGSNTTLGRPQGRRTVSFTLPYNGATETVKIFNLRVNAAQAGEPGSPIRLNIAGIGPVEVATTALSLTYSTTPVTLLQCEPLNAALASSGAATASAAQLTGQEVSLRFGERFSSAFRARDLEAAYSPDEIARLRQLAVEFERRLLREYGLLADRGTIVRTRFDGTPEGFQLWAPKTVRSGSLALEARNFVDGVPVPIEGPGEYFKLGTRYSTSSTTGTTWILDYEVTSSDPNRIEDIAVPIRYAYSAGILTGSTFANVSTRYDGIISPHWLIEGSAPRSYPEFFDAGALTPGSDSVALMTLRPCSTSTTPYGFVVPSGIRNAQNEIEPGLLPRTFFTMHVTTTNPAINGVNAVPMATTARQATSAWLTVDTLSAVTPASLRIAVDPTGLLPGSYLGSIRVSGTGVPAANLPIRLNVPAPGPGFSRWGVANAGSYSSNVVSPGEALVIFGERFGPPMLASAALTANGTLSTVIGETRVLFDGVAAPMIYAVSGQVSCLAPFALAGKNSTTVEVEYRGVKSRPIVIPVIPAVPALLTADASGFGKAAALNQDGSFNSVRGGAPGDFVVLFGVGGPATNPASRDGEITRAPVPQFTGPLGIRLAGEEVPMESIAYLGPAPGLVHGVWQANVRIPANARPGSSLPVQVRFGEVLTQVGVTISVR